MLSGRYNVKAIDKHPVRLIFISLFLFSQLPGIGQIVLYFGVSGRCLEGVWEVSGGCLGDSGYYVGGMMFKKQINIQSDSFSLAYSFFPQLPQIGQNVPYFGVSFGCLEGVWEVPRGCLSDSGYCHGGYGVH